MEAAVLGFILIVAALLAGFLLRRRIEAKDSTFSGPGRARPPESGGPEDGEKQAVDKLLVPPQGWGSSEGATTSEPVSRPPATRQLPELALPPAPPSPPPPAMIAEPELSVSETNADLDDSLRPGGQAPDWGAPTIPQPQFGGQESSWPGESAEPPPPAAEYGPEPARFSAYYPREVPPQTWLPLRAYVFRRSAAGAVEADAAAALKERVEDYRPVSGDATASLAEGVLITATPELDGFQFNPPSAPIAFYEDWQAFPFKLRAVTAPLEQAANGRITFSAEGVIVADLPISVFVTAQPAAASTAPSSASADPYDAIFCSYSHKDTAIVERVERAYKALGMDYLRDVTTLRSGETWNPRLLELIEEADIFQLFWSNASAASRYVEQEWAHALSLGRGGAFIRPVYWEQPMPKAPDALGHLHFHFDPALAESR